jgi:indole-3-glycerol phosphate synthase
VGLLDEIVEHKRHEVAERRTRRSLHDLQAACRDLPPAREFETALHPAPPARVRLIAEIKRASPSKGVLRGDLDPVAQARTYARAGAAALSVLTDQRWFRGSLEDLVAVREATDLPVLRKEFIVDEYQLWESRAAGADAVLLIVGAHEPSALADLFHAAKGAGLGTLIEAHTVDELDRACALHAPVIGINNRDLQTLAIDIETSLRLLPRVPPGPVAVSESGIDSAAVVERLARAGAHAVLVGEALVRARDAEAAARALQLLNA